MKNRDWNGDKHSIMIQLGLGKGGAEYYATEPKAVDSLIRNFPLPRKVWECACGEGSLSKRFEEKGYMTYSSDIDPRGYGECRDFFTYKTLPLTGCCIVTNPPSSKAEAFIRHSLTLLPEGGVCCMFLKTTFLEGKKRYNEIYRHTPPMYVLQFIERIKCARNGEFDKMEGSAVSFAWFVWRKGYKGNTIVKWI